jgi:hypothetical protein
LTVPLTAPGVIAVTVPEIWLRALIFMVLLPNMRLQR